MDCNLNESQYPNPSACLIQQGNLVGVDVIGLFLKVGSYSKSKFWILTQSGKKPLLDEKIIIQIQDLFMKKHKK